MKKIQKLLFAVPVIFSLFAIPAVAKNNVSDIDIQVSVRDDGSAQVIQTWQGTFYEGTENYIPINTENIAVSDFGVSDEKGEYTRIDEWTIAADFEEKARKCGVYETADGVELCFGISEYGENKYEIRYVIEEFVKSYTDFDGTNFMFINPGMSTFPTDGRIRIQLENENGLNTDNAAIWAFGYDGDVAFQNGSVYAQTAQALEENDSMILMLRLKKGLVFPKTFVDTSFDTVKNEAFKGSDYGYGNREGYQDVGFFEKIMGILLLIGIPAVGLMLLVFVIKRKKEIRKFYKETAYFRGTPNDGKIEVSHYLAQNFDVADEESLIIGALILSMINKGVIKPQTEENIGFFGKAKESVHLQLIKEPDTATEYSLYSILLSAAGEDGVLQEKELEKYAYRHPEKITAFMDGVKENGEVAFISQGGFLAGAGNRIKNLSDKGRSELAEIMGLKKYLEEFTLIAEREITETAIWKEYMVYATLFGIAEKVQKQLEKVYPERIPEWESYGRNVIIANSYYRSMYLSSRRAIAAQRASGMGGRASFGGGGGFSGGGRGGGSR